MKMEKSRKNGEGVALEDYWQEFSSFAVHPDEDEDEAAKTPDEGEAEEQWLIEAGLETLVNNESPEQPGCDDILSTLTSRQRGVVLKRLHALEMTKKKHRGRQRADVRQVFGSLKDESHVPERGKGEAALLKIVPPSPHCPEQSAVPRSHPAKPSSSVLPPFLRTSHSSGGFSLREHSKAIDSESHASSVEVLKYESRTSSMQNYEPVFGEGRERNGSEEISFQGISSRLGPATEQKESVDDLRWQQHIPVSELCEEDRTAVRALSVIEAAALLDGHGLLLRRCRRKAAAKNKDNAVLGLSLSALLDLDRKRCPGLKIPLIYQWVLHHLDGSGLKEEGLMRLAGSFQKIEALKSECEKHYATHPMLVENCIRQASVYDVAVFLKQMIRQLPEPLLTYSHVDAFLQVPNVPVIQEQICALNLLVLALPDVHRELLQELLHLLKKIVDHQECNRMSLSNVAMIIAPNLFPPPRLKKNHHPSKNNDLEAEVTIAALSSKVTQLLIKYNHCLGMVPKDLLAQARLQSQYSSKKQAKCSRGRKVKNEKIDRINKVIVSAIGRGSVIRVHFPSSPYLNAVPVTVDDHTTAADVILQVARLMAVLADPAADQQENKAIFFQRSRTESEPPHMHQKCLLGTKNSVDCLQGHSLYYVAENVGECKVDLNTSVLSYWSRNSSWASTWHIRCHH